MGMKNMLQDLFVKRESAADAFCWKSRQIQVFASSRWKVSAGCV